MLWSKSKNLTILLCILFPFLFSCGIFDFRPVIITTSLDDGNTLLPARTSPITIVFSDEPVHLDVEKALAIENTKGPIEIDIFWDGNICTIKPAEPWVPSEQYFFTLKGTIAMQDGRKTKAAIYNSFFAVRNTRAPYVKEIYPQNGAIINTRPERVIQLTFSEPMDAVAVERALIFDPVFPAVFEWNSDNTVLLVKRKNNALLSPCARYTWKLDKKACAIDGAPLELPQMQYFLTMENVEHQQVVKTFPANIADGAIQLLDTSSLTDGFHYNYSIVIEFKYDIDPDSLLAKKIVLFPGIEGTVVLINPKQLLFTPATIIPPQTKLMLYVPSTISTTDGLPMQQDYVEYFTCATPWMKLTGLQDRITNPEHVYTDPDGTDTYIIKKVMVTQTNPDPDITGAGNNIVESYIVIVLTFNASFTTHEQKLKFIECVSFTSLNSGTLSTAYRYVLTGVSWSNNDTTVALTYKQDTLQPIPIGSSGGTGNLYRLIIKGGINGIEAQTFLRDDIVLYMEVQ